MTIGVGFADYQPPLTTISAAATATVTGLVGWDVDSKESVIVVRTNSGDMVRTFDSYGSLGVLAESGSEDTDCLGEGGVFAVDTGELVAFTDCAGGGDPEKLSIRRSNMATPSQADFSGCQTPPEPNEFGCQAFINLDGHTTSSFEQAIISEAAEAHGATCDGSASDAGGDGSGMIGQVAGFPIDMSFDSPNGENSNIMVAWAYAHDISNGDPGVVGRVGVNAYTNQEDDADNFCFDEVQASTAAVEDFCLELDGAGYYLAAVSATAPTRVYDVEFTTELGPVSGALEQNFLIPSITDTFNLASAHGAASGVSCGGQRVAVQNPSGVFVVDRLSGAQVASFEATFADNRGVGLSEVFGHPLDSSVDVQYIALLDTADFVRIGNVTSEVVTCSIDVPTGTYAGMHMGVRGQSLWLFTSTTIAYYDIRACTTLEPAPPVPSFGFCLLNPTEASCVPVIQEICLEDPDNAVCAEFCEAFPLNPACALGGGGGEEEDTCFAICEEVIIPGTGRVGGGLFFGAIIVLGMAVTGGTAGTATRSAIGVAVLAIVGAIAGVLMAWAFGWFNDAAILAIVALVVVGVILFSVIRGGG